ncbi:PfkB family carbohydrate kinase [soil metagenome]
MALERSSVCVFAPALFATVTVEASDDEFDDIHFHMGGQGFWVARMIRALGERSILCAPVGGESGEVLTGLVAATKLDFAPVRMAGASPAYVHDRRDGNREVVATSRSPELTRHEMDDLFGNTLRHAIGSGTCVITGRPEGDRLTAGFYRRLGANLAAAGVRSVGDFHGEELKSFLEGGPLDILKVSDDDLGEDGLAVDHDEAVWEAVDVLVSSGARAVVVSQGSRGALASFDGVRMRARSPEFEVVDHTGAGDSMTAALAVAVVRELSPTDALRLACAAGAANVTRHGLGSSQAELVERLVDLVDVEELVP